MAVHAMHMRPTEQPELTVVIPVLDEREALPGLIEELNAVLDQTGRSNEVIFVDDGSTDGSREYLAEVASEHAHLDLVPLARNYGKSAALDAGFSRSRGEIVITLDGDGQDEPAAIPTLLAKLDGGYDLVSGWKRSRQDSSERRWASRLFNRTTARLSGVPLHDFNCGLKAYRGDRIRSLAIYGELHRFIPVLGAQRGWRMTEVEVPHRPRRHGRSKFGLERYMRGLLDLISVLFLNRYQHRPLHLFGGLGLGMILIGVAFGVYLTIEKIGGAAIGDRPLLLLSVLLIIVGMQFLTFGLLAQLLVAMRHDRSVPIADRLPGPEHRESPDDPRVPTAADRGP